MKKLFFKRVLIVFGAIFLVFGFSAPSSWTSVTHAAGCVISTSSLAPFITAGKEIDYDGVYQDCNGSHVTINLFTTSDVFIRTVDQYPVTKNTDTNRTIFQVSKSGSYYLYLELVTQDGQVLSKQSRNFEIIAASAPLPTAGSGTDTGSTGAGAGSGAGYGNTNPEDCDSIALNPTQQEECRQRHPDCNSISLTPEEQAACRQQTGQPPAFGAGAGSSAGKAGDAAGKNPTTSAGEDGGFPGVDLTIQGIFKTITTFACYLWSISIVLIFIFIIIAGLRFMAARDNPAAVTAAMKNFKSVIIGAIVVMGVYVIIATVANAVGVDLSLVPFNCSLSSQLGGSEKTTNTGGIGAGAGSSAGKAGDASGAGAGAAKGGQCTDLSSLAAQNDEPYPAQNAPELDALISCIRSAEILKNQNLGSQFTVDVNHPTCNYTRGQPLCEASCSHARNSCHYGGRSGADGALAVNFGNEKIYAKIIQAAQECGAKTARCENASGPVSCTSSTATHVYVNTTSCDVN